MFDAGKQRSETVIFNYLEGQVELTNKDRLYRNLKRTHPDAIGKYVPITYLVDFRQDAAQVQESLTHFLSHYFKRTVVSKLKPFVVKSYFMEIGYTRKQLARIMEQSQSMTNE